jgi:hypothetical protein
MLRLHAELEEARERLQLTENSHAAIEQMLSEGVLSKRKDGVLELIPQ